MIGKIQPSMGRVNFGNGTPPTEEALRREAQALRVALFKANIGTLKSTLNAQPPNIQTVGRKLIESLSRAAEAL